jgi:undecaprenyl-diphosphatase
LKKVGREMLINIISIISVIIIPLLGVAIYAYYVAENGNFHEITKGEAFRAAQMNGTELEHCIINYHLKSILNLRGKYPEEKWYCDEMKICAKYGVMHYDVSLSAYRELSPEEFKMLKGIFDAAPRPILILCQAGADRAGLVAAMWKLTVDKESRIDAVKQLSILFGHMSIGPPSAMDRSFEHWHPA